MSVLPGVLHVKAAKVVFPFIVEEAAVGAKVTPNPAGVNPAAPRLFVQFPLTVSGSTSVRAPLPVIVILLNTFVPEVRELLPLKTNVDPVVVTL